MIYTKKDLESFFIALDSELQSKHTIILIGGAAAALHYKSKIGTIDIGTYNSIEDLKEAYRRTLAKHPELKIPFNAALPAQGPVHMEKRLEEYHEISLKKLTIKIPEAHDWIMLKTARCEEKDIADMKDLAKQYKIDPAILLKLFKEEMLPHNPGNDQNLKANYLYMINVIFGLRLAEEHEKSLQHR